MGRQLGDVQRAAQGGLLLQQRHGEAPLGQDDGALQAAGAAAHAAGQIGEEGMLCIHGDALRVQLLFQPQGGYGIA